ncbi:MAG: hypothetical protein ABFS30_12110 [Pseudomonadota bacterium]
MNGSGPGLFEAVIESWRLVIGNAAALARVALVPFLLFMALHRLGETFRPEGMAILAWDLLFTTLAAVPAVMLLMPWYRQLLAPSDPSLGSRPTMWWSIVLMLRWMGLDMMFFAALAPIAAISIRTMTTAVESAPENSGIVVFYFATFIISAYLFYGRMGLALPAAAAESDHSYRRSWTETGNNGWRIGFAILLCWLSIQIPVDILRQPLAVENPTLAAQYLDAALGALFRTVNELLGAAVFAQFYLARRARPSEDED